MFIIVIVCVKEETVRDECERSVLPTEQTPSTWDAEKGITEKERQIGVSLAGKGCSTREGRVLNHGDSAVPQTKRLIV